MQTLGTYTTLHVVIYHGKTKKGTYTTYIILSNVQNFYQHARKTILYLISLSLTITITKVVVAVYIYTIYAKLCDVVVSGFSSLDMRTVYNKLNYIIIYSINQKTTPATYNNILRRTQAAINDRCTLYDVTVLNFIFKCNYF